jgi:hypothetical protein
MIILTICGAFYLTQSVFAAVLTLVLACAILLATSALSAEPRTSPSRAPIFETLELPPGTVANANLEDLYLDPPLGEVKLGDVRFLLKGGPGSIFDTNEQIRYGRLADGSIEVPLTLPEPVQPVAVHILINASGGWRTYADSEKDIRADLEWSMIGKIKLEFADGTAQTTQLVLGDNIREWAIGNNPSRLVSRVADPASRVVWRGKNQSQNYAVIDHLEIPIQPSNRDKELRRIVFVRDVPQHRFLLKTPHLHLLVFAVTLEFGGNP